MANKYPPAPSHLSARAGVLWGELGPRYGDTAGRRLLLEQALRLLDCAEEARMAIAADGMFIKTASTGAVHQHPALKIEQSSITEARKILLALGASTIDLGL